MDRILHLTEAELAQLTPIERTAVEELWAIQERGLNATAVEIQVREAQRFQVKMASLGEDRRKQAASQYEKPPVKWSPTR